MHIHKLIRTVRHLRVKQVVWQVRNRLINPRFIAEVEASSVSLRNSVEPCAKLMSILGERMEFLNIAENFCGWNDLRHGMLWAYNLNYMDWLGQPNMTEKDGAKWIDRFIADLATNKIGLDPYPIALRSINWIKFFCKYPTQATKPRLNALYSQVLHLEKRLEYHLLGNHLLEDAFALYIAGNYFDDKRLLNQSKKLLLNELQEQVLPDGAHYEQSPMYHCILLDRLLDCINYSNEDCSALKKFAVQMLGHLKSICWADNSIPLLNDSACGIAPTPNEIFDYARRLSLSWQQNAMKECGYRKMHNEKVEALVDIGGITSTYQPGHSHADTFSFELRIGGMPFIVDTGISTYEKTARRQYERSTEAHNTVTLENRNSSEVWGGFRVGERATVTLHCDEPNVISASHSGFGRHNIHTRNFTLTDGAFSVTDKMSTSAECVSRLHLAPGLQIITVSKDEIITSGGRINIINATEINLKEAQISRQYNRFEAGIVVEMIFRDTLQYQISF